MRLFGRELRWSRPQEQTKEVAPDVEKQSISSSNQQIYYYTPPSALLTALGATSSTSQLLADPREKLLTYKTMVAAFPEVSRMLWYHRLILGCPYIESEDQGFADEANAVLAEMAWREQMDYEGNRNAGIDDFVGRLAVNTMALGQSFYTFLDQQGNPALTSRQKIDSIQFHDSERFAYFQFNVDQFQLQYTAKGIVVQDKRIDNAFKSVRFDSISSYAWGKPLLYNSEAVALTAAIYQENQKGVYRMQNSPRVTIFNMEPVLDQKDASVTAAVLSRNYQEAWDKAATNLRQSYATALEQSASTGRAVDITTSIVGKIDAKTHSMADNIDPIDTYPEDIRLELSRLVVSLNGEPSLVGLGETGDGLNSNRSEILMEGMASYGTGLRKTLNPHVKLILEAKMMRESRRIPKYEIEWEGLSTTDIKAIAEVEEIKARTQAGWVQAVTMLTQAGELEAATKFAEENELDWFEGSTAVPLL